MMGGYGLRGRGFWVSAGWGFRDSGWGDLGFGGAGVTLCLGGVVYWVGFWVGGIVIAGAGL